MAHRWTELLKLTIAAEYGEPERLGEHCESASEAVLGYLESLGYSDDTFNDRVQYQAYELYLFAKHLHGKGKLVDDETTTDCIKNLTT